MPKAAKCSKRDEMKVGCTPTGIRRFFFKLELLGKRRSELLYDYSNLDPVVDTPPEKPRQRPLPSPHRNEGGPSAPAQSTLPKDARVQPWPRADRVALINEDYAENALVITTLDDILFCCHEDLITMPRDQLIGVALSLNAKLPSAFAIAIDHDLSTSYIRSSIERIVGLRGDVPQAPKAPRMLPDSDLDKRLLADFAQMDKSPPTSPLAGRSRSQGQLMSLTSARLARLDEEEEGELDVDAADRHSKKRKLSFDNHQSETDSDVDMDPVQTPTPLPRIQRARSHYTAPSVSPIPTRVLRSQSQKLEKPTTIDTAFIHNKRSTYRYQSKAKRATVDARPDRASPISKLIGVPGRRGRLRPVSDHRPLVLSANHCDRPSNASIDSLFSRINKDSTTSSTVIGAKRKRTNGRTEAEKQMTSGIGRLNMGSSKEFDEMDIGP